MKKIKISKRHFNEVVVRSTQPREKVATLLPKVVTDVVDGIITKKVELEEWKDNADLKARDFSIDNLIAVGAVDMLQEAPKVSVGTLNAADVLSAYLGTIPEQIDPITTETVIDETKETEKTEE